MTTRTRIQIALAFAALAAAPLAVGDDFGSCLRTESLTTCQARFPDADQPDKPLEPAATSKPLSVCAALLYEATDRVERSISLLRYGLDTEAAAASRQSRSLAAEAARCEMSASDRSAAAESVWSNRRREYEAQLNILVAVQAAATSAQ